MLCAVVHLAVAQVVLLTCLFPGSCVVWTSAVIVMVSVLWWGKGETDGLGLTVSSTVGLVSALVGVDCSWVLGCSSKTI